MGQFKVYRKDGSIHTSSHIREGSMLRTIRNTLNSAMIVSGGIEEFFVMVNMSGRDVILGTAYMALHSPPDFYVEFNNIVDL